MINRSFLYGDGLFETIRVSEGRALHLLAHFERLSRGLSLLKMQDPQKPLTYQEFKIMIEGFIAQQTTANLRIRSTFFRALGGRYTPQKQTFEYYFEASPLQSASYSNHESSITIGIAQQVRLSVDALSNLKTTSALPYVLAGIEKQEKGWDDCLLLNHRGYLAEAVAANVFLKQGKRVLTPALDQGCVAGIMRQQLLHLLPQLGYQVKETTVDLAQLQEAEEVWLTNALQGVVGIHQWLGRHKPYKQVAVREVQEYLNLWIKKSEL